MKVVIIGLPYFSNKLTDSLINYDNNNSYLSLNTWEKYFDRFKFIFNLFNTDLIYSIGGSISKARAIDLALFTHKRVIMHWVGTDVVKACNDYDTGSFSKRYIHEIRHFCETPWIQEELKHIGINAEIVQFATFDKKISSTISLPHKFSILSYIGKGREEFYGINSLIRLAIDFPDIEIKVTGVGGYQKPVPANLIFLGWVDNLDEEYKNCVLYLRLPEHDGLSFSVLEALTNARYVGYTHKFNQTYHIDSYLKLYDITKNLKEQYDGKQLKENIQGMNFVKKEFSENIVLGNLLKLFRD